jgi:orotidine-5'-phosphate decarboxylase
MTKTFLQAYQKALKEKNSVLCLGLDPALPQQRKNDVMPASYEVLDDENETRLNFCLDVLNKTSDFCVAAKPNEQYLRGFTSKQHKELADAIRNRGLLSIYDCKLGDIRDTAESAIFHIQRWGYDAITFNPFPGNTEEIVKIAHSYNPQLGIIVLTLMSNPEAQLFMKQAQVDGMPVYLKVASEVKKYGADGCVVGATGHVTETEITSIRKIAGKDKIFLIPGIGTQRGDPEKVIKNSGKNILINVGRDIIYSENPGNKAKEYCSLFNNLRKRLSQENLMI